MLDKVYASTKQKHVVERLRTIVSEQAMTLVEMKLLLAQLEEGDFGDYSDELADRIKLQFSVQARVMRHFVSIIQQHGRLAKSDAFNFALMKGQWLDKLEELTGLPTGLLDEL